MKKLRSNLSQGGGHRGGGQFDNPPDIYIEYECGANRCGVSSFDKINFPE